MGLTLYSVAAIASIGGGTLFIIMYVIHKFKQRYEKGEKLDDQVCFLHTASPPSEWIYSSFLGKCEVDRLFCGMLT